MKATVAASLELEAEPAEAFAALVAELAAALARLGLRAELQAGGTIVDAHGFEAGRVGEWEDGRQALLEWRAADWLPDESSELELRAERTETGARLVVEHRGFGAALEGDVAGWFAEELAAALVRSSAPSRLGDWLTDRRARRPSGLGSRCYADPTFHRPSFGAVLEALDLGPDDRLLELGCGGGAFLQLALATGCRAAAVDHSPEMVQLARETNRAAVDAAALDVVVADVTALPFDDGSFTAVASMQAFFFFDDPLATLHEALRMLVPGGRLAIVTTAPELRGTMAAPEPMASRGRFYADEELAALARAAGFADVLVTRPDLGPHARAAGLPSDVVAIFAGERGTQLLVGLRR